MPQSKREIQALLSEAGMSPRHRFGQNFMIDQNLVRVVADAGDVRPGDLVIEVGPGTGTLTAELLARGAEVLAVEIDRDLAAVLARQFEPRAGRPCHGGFRLIEGDAMSGKYALHPEVASAIASAARANRPVKLVANLPYNIASPLVIELLLAGVERLAFTVQKEVAQRLASPPGRANYGPLSIMAQLLADVEVLRTLPPEVFWPSPAVESAVVRMVRGDRLAVDAREFSAFVQKMFAARRKMLRKSLAQAGYEAEACLSELGIQPTQRAEEIAPERWLALFRKLRATFGNFPIPNASNDCIIG